MALEKLGAKRSQNRRFRNGALGTGCGAWNVEKTSRFVLFAYVGAESHLLRFAVLLRRLPGLGQKAEYLGCGSHLSGCPFSANKRICKSRICYHSSHACALPSLLVVLGNCWLRDHNESDEVGVPCTGIRKVGLASKIPLNSLSKYQNPPNRKHHESLVLDCKGHRGLAPISESRNLAHGIRKGKGHQSRIPFGRLFNPSDKGGFRGNLSEELYYRL